MEKFLAIPQKETNRHTHLRVKTKLSRTVLIVCNVCVCVYDSLFYLFVFNDSILLDNETTCVWLPNNIIYQCQSRYNPIAKVDRSRQLSWVDVVEPNKKGEAPRKHEQLNNLPTWGTLWDNENFRNLILHFDLRRCLHSGLIFFFQYHHSLHMRLISNPNHLDSSLQLLKNLWKICCLHILQNLGVGTGTCKNGQVGRETDISQEVVMLIYLDVESIRTAAGISCDGRLSAISAPVLGWRRPHVSSRGGPTVYRDCDKSKQPLWIDPGESGLGRLRICCSWFGILLAPIHSHCWGPRSRHHDLLTVQSNGSCRPAPRVSNKFITTWTKYT